jgi:hypothetical protein
VAAFACGVFNFLTVAGLVKDFFEGAGGLAEYLVGVSSF